MFASFNPALVQYIFVLTQKMVLWFIEESSNQFLPRVVCSKAITLLDWFLMRGIRIGIDKLQ